MGLFNIPDPVSMVESAKNAGMEREVANSIFSAYYSSAISFAWRSGQARWADWTGEGQALKDAATSMYLSLAELQKKGFLVLTVPQDMLQADNLARFQTEEKTK